MSDVKRAPQSAAPDKFYPLGKARRNPSGLFVGSAETLAKLRDAMAFNEPASDAGSPAQQSIDGHRT
jgi:hypothetical protein